MIPPNCEGSKCPFYATDTLLEDTHCLLGYYEKCNAEEMEKRKMARLIKIGLSEPNPKEMTTIS